MPLSTVPLSETPLRLAGAAYLAMLDHAWAGLPDEACGLLGGSMADGTVDLFFPCRNSDRSSRTYSIGALDWADADDAISAAGLEMVGVMHSHTHSDAYPSTTDVDKGDNPLLAGWHFIIVSLAQGTPVLRSYRLDDRVIAEEPVALVAMPTA